MFWIKAGSAAMFLAVSLGAFGAHGLKDKLSAYSMDVYNKAVFYHFIHALALFLVAWLSTLYPRASLAGWMFLAGLMIFCGSLYLLAVTDMKWLGAVTPIGGLCFLSGWAMLFLLKP